jgi:integrase
MRNPKDPRWPRGGERTELREVAERWKWAYVDLYRQDHRDRMIGTAKPRLLRDATAEYLEHRAPLVARSTLQNDRTALAHLADDFPGAAVHTIDPQRTLNRLLREGYRPYTVWIYSQFLSGFWKWCGLEYAVEFPKWQQREARTWTDAEVGRIRAEARDLLVSLDCALYMGLRYGEIMGLEWEDVDLSTWTVRVRRQKNGQPLKSRRTRTALILPGWTHDVGTGRVADHRTERLRAVLKRAGLTEKGVGWHTGRHTYARMFLEAKPDMRLLQASLGHSSVTVTEAAYNHLLPDRAAELARVAIHGR